MFGRRDEKQINKVLSQRARLAQNEIKKPLGISVTTCVNYLTPGCLHYMNILIQCCSLISSRFGTFNIVWVDKDHRKIEKDLKSNQTFTWLLIMARLPITMEIWAVDFFLHLNSTILEL